jgi:hypothetical protein
MRCVLDATVSQESGEDFMGVELELAVLLAFSVLGQRTFARFEIETPASRKILKWFTMAAITNDDFWA